jgi:hypothetical protein
MRLDKDTLLNEVAGHQERMKSPLWSKDGGEPDESWNQSIRYDPPVPTETTIHAPTYESPPRPPSIQREHAPQSSIQREHAPQSSMPREMSPEPSMTEILPRLDALEHAITRLSAEMSRRPAGREGLPGWLAGVGGDPHSYDGPDSGRKGVCVRILPSTYAQLQAIQRRMGLRTIATAWEYLLRLGFAAAERLPA